MKRSWLDLTSHPSTLLLLPLIHTLELICNDFCSHDSSYLLTTGIKLCVPEACFHPMSSASISFSLLVEFIYFKRGNPLPLRHSDANTLSAEESGEIMHAENSSSGNQSYNINSYCDGKLSFLQVSELSHLFTELGALTPWWISTEWAHTANAMDSNSNWCWCCWWSQQWFLTADMLHSWYKETYIFCLHLGVVVSEFNSPMSLHGFPAPRGARCLEQQYKKQSWSAALYCGSQRLFNPPVYQF